MREHGFCFLPSRPNAGVSARGVTTEVVPARPESGQVLFCGGSRSGRNGSGSAFRFYFGRLPMIAFSCPKCQTTLKAPDEKVGANSKCPKCGCPVQVPGCPISKPPVVADVRPVQASPHWYYCRDGKRFGPFAESVVYEAVGRGEVRSHDQVWRQGLPGWEPASKHFTFAPRPMSPVARTSTGEHTAPSSGLSPAQQELLIRVTKQPVDAAMQAAWAPLVGSVADNVMRFVRSGLLEEATPLEKISCKFRVADLKPLLKQHGAKTSGKKAELIATFLKVLPTDDVTRLVGDMKLYHATALGQRAIDAYLEDQRRAWEAVETDTLACLLKGDVNTACRRIAEYDARQVFPSHGTLTASLDQAVYLLMHSYADLPLPENQRRLVGAHLALSALLGSGYEDASRRLLAVTSGAFSCPALDEFLRGDPAGSYAGDFAGEDGASVAYLYAFSRLREATEATKLRELVSAHFGQGIEIRHDGGCRICDRRKHKYRWSEIGAIPKLPLHWGCDCSYEAWM